MLSCDLEESLFFHYVMHFFINQPHPLYVSNLCRSLCDTCLCHAAMTIVWRIVFAVYSLCYFYQHSLESRTSRNISQAIFVSTSISLNSPTAHERTCNSHISLSTLVYRRPVDPRKHKAHLSSLNLLILSTSNFIIRKSINRHHARWHCIDLDLLYHRFRFVRGPSICRQVHLPMLQIRYKASGEGKRSGWECLEIGRWVSYSGIIRWWWVLNNYYLEFVASELSWYSFCTPFRVSGSICDVRLC